MKAKRFFGLLVAAALVFALLPATPAMAADGDVIYVNGASGNDATGNGSSGSPAKTLKRALELVNAGGTIYVASGTYSGGDNCGITIGKNVAIIGADTANPVFDAQSLGQIFYVSSLTTVSLQNLTLTNGYAGMGGAIENNGILTATDCIFTHNATSSVPDGGGAIFNNNTLTVTGCTFADNHTTNFVGGAIYNLGTLTATDCTFTGNSATNGGAIYSFATASASIRFCRFTGNTTPSATGSDIFAPWTVSAEYNWWGTNEGPSSRVSGGVVADPWLVLRVTASPASVATGAASTVTADLLHDSDGGYHAPASGHVPDGVAVSFAVQSGPGGVTPASATLANGAAAASFSASSTGTGVVAATVDGYTRTADVTVTRASAPLPDYISRILTGSGTGITISGNISPDAQLTIGDMALGSGSAHKTIRKWMNNKNYILLAGRDISLSGSFTGELTISIPVGAQYNGQSVTVLHAKRDGTLATYTVKVADGKVTFKVTSLSPFAVFASASGVEPPQTGGENILPVGLGLLALGALGVLLALRRRGRRA